MDQNAKTQAIEQIKKAQNVLVTVSDNPSVDQLAAAIGFTLLLNKLNKHATAVFSGQIPSTIEFLKPEETLEGNTDSLRDFIISLDKNKADKLRYKVEDDVVRIYVTPYRTSISEQDLTFSQGDFNVDVVIALGVYNQDQLDKAIQDHGRILHDAAIISVIAGGDGADIGGINWSDQNASSLCEMLMGISESLKSGVIDEQIATALLTGIVAETDRFSNEKTTPKAMTMSAQLMSAGANQQLISESLKPEPEPEPEQPADEQKPDYEEESGPSLADIQTEQPQEETEEDGVLNLHHDHDTRQNQPEEPKEVEDHHIGIDNDGKFANAEQLREQVEEVQSGGSFKGKTIEPPEDYEPGGQLPSLDGSPSYTPGVVTNAPISATDDGNSPVDNSQWHLPQVDWAQQGDSQSAQQDVSQGQPPEDNRYADSSYDQNLQLPPQQQAQQTNQPPVIPMSQGQPYIKPDDIPKQHDEDSLSEEEAEALVKRQEADQNQIPEIKSEHSKREFLDHPPSTDPGDDDFKDEEEKPAIEQDRERYSKYLSEPPKDEPRLNALDGATQEETVDPLAETSESAAKKEQQQGKPKEDPWLSTQHDAESPRASEVPETRHPRLYDDGVGVSKNKRLGAPVSDYNTLDEIEESVRDTAGQVHGSKNEDAARDAVKDALSGAPQDNPFDYLELDSDPAKAPEQAPNVAPPPISPLQAQPPEDGPPPVPPPLMPPGMPS